MMGMKHEHDNSIFPLSVFLWFSFFSHSFRGFERDMFGWVGRLSSFFFSLEGFCFCVLLLRHRYYCGSLYSCALFHTRLLIESAPLFHPLVFIPVVGLSARGSLVSISQ